MPRPWGGKAGPRARRGVENTSREAGNKGPDLAASAGLGFDADSKRESVTTHWRLLAEERLRVGQGLKGSFWLQCEGRRRQEREGREASAIIQATGDGGLDESGERKLDSGNTLNIEPMGKPEHHRKQKGGSLE